MLKTGARLIIISSVSGGGKTSLISRLTRDHADLHVAVTATSRAPRQNEVEGQHYYFYAAEDFERKIEAGEFLEHARVHGNYYGVPAAPVEAKLAEGVSVILNIDVQGMRSVKERMAGRVLSIFLLPPDLKVWEERLRKRGTDSEEDIQLRLQQGIGEMAAADEYDYQITNDMLERATGEVSFILRQAGVVRD
ncbi:MAG: guanylate kinase [Leptospirales bacterium]|jgi:guanylate kinase